MALIDQISDPLELMLSAIRTLLLLLAGIPCLALAGPLQTFENCSLVEADWSDGDSFPVTLPSGDELTVRLYGVDCMEWKIQDTSDSSRLRAQRRYFGISVLEGGPQVSIELATSFGALAAAEVATILAEPFTVHTAMADGRGDPRYPRVYAFIELSDARDLGEHLVTQGLARAYGVSRATPDGRSREEYQAYLKDLELIAARTGAGIWGETRWEQISEERRVQRIEDEEDAIATGTRKLQAGDRVDVNTASRDELVRLYGIGESLAFAIIEARPIKTAEALDDVPGIGPKTIEKNLPYLDFSLAE